MTIRIWTGASAASIDRAFKKPLSGTGVQARVMRYNGKLPKFDAGDVVMACGKEPVSLLQRAGVFPKGRAIGSLRCKHFKRGQAHVVASWDPGIISFDYARKPELEWDARLAVRLAKTGGVEPEVGEYNYVDDLTDAVDYVNNHYYPGHRVPVSMDLETVGLVPWAAGVHIVSITVTYEPGHSDVVRFPHGPLSPHYPGVAYPTDEAALLLHQIKWLCSSNRVNLIGANFKFDMQWMAVHWGVEDYGAYRLDTLLVGSLLDENRGNSLNLHAKLFTPLGGYDDAFNATHDKGRMDLVLAKDPEGFLTYAGGDTDACYQVSRAFKAELLADNRLANFYQRLLHPAAKAFRKIEQRGMVVDVARYHKLEAEVTAEIKDLEASILSKINRRIQNKYLKKNTLVPAMIQDYLFKHPLGLRLKPLMFTAKATPEQVEARDPDKASTSNEHLQELGQKSEDAKEFADLMQERGQAKKTLTTYIRGFSKHIRPDGRFHPSYLLHKGEYADDDEAGTLTGRLSAKDPAYQTIPKHTRYAKRLREVYVTPPGHVIVNVDYAQGELKITACLAREEEMIKTYLQGIDLHLKTGASVFGLELEEALELKAKGDPLVKQVRQGGKAGNFGLIYGMSAVPGFMNYARRVYFVHLTEEESYKFHNTFFETYPRLHPWHQESRETMHRDEAIRSPLGRIRRLPLINGHDRGVVARQERQGLNAQVQSTLSDMSLLSSALLDEQYPELWCFGMTHDALSFYVPEDEVQVWVPRIVRVMANLPLKDWFGWDHQLPFPVDVEVSEPGGDMGHMREVDLIEEFGINGLGEAA